MNYIPTIGIEMHCEMKSHTKVFSRARNTYSEEANIHVSPVDIGLPGILPVLNKECVRKAIKAACILNCTIPKYLYFDRKNYYYPDLPKGYQITQSHDPIGQNGKILVPFQDGDFEVLIHDIHLEEDSAQLEHIGRYSYINYNRSGVPLLELVTEPCFHSKEEVIAFLEYIRRVYQYADISLADATKGQIRCDVNISLSKDDTLGTKVEVKNVNSFANVGAVIDSEIERQLHLITCGRAEEIEQETRRFDEESGETKRMRSKADAIDYKYFVEPNIPKIRIDEKMIDEIKKEIPVLPRERFLKYTKDYGLTKVDAQTILKEKAISDYFDSWIDAGIEPLEACNWIIGPILGYLNKEGMKISDFEFSIADFQFVLEKLHDGTISSKQAKEIVGKMLTEHASPKDLITHDFAQISDEEVLNQIISEIIERSSEQLEAYKNGRTNLFSYFVGQVMKETGGKANPIKTRDLLEKKLK